MLAGFAGGIGRGLVEGPFEYIKTMSSSFRMEMESVRGFQETVFRVPFCSVRSLCKCNLFPEGVMQPFWRAQYVRILLGSRFGLSMLSSLSVNLDDTQTKVRLCF